MKFSELKQGMRVKLDNAYGSVVMMTSPNFGRAYIHWDGNPRDSLQCVTPMWVWLSELEPASKTVTGYSLYRHEVEKIQASWWRKLYRRQATTVDESDFRWAFGLRGPLANGTVSH